MEGCRRQVGEWVVRGERTCCFLLFPFASGVNEVIARVGRSMDTKATASIVSLSPCVVSCGFRSHHPHRRSWSDALLGSRTERRSSQKMTNLLMDNVTMVILTFGFNACLRKDCLVLDVASGSIIDVSQSSRRRQFFDDAKATLHRNGGCTNLASPFATDWDPLRSYRILQTKLLSSLSSLRSS